jgi:hypothetical protein
MTQDDKDALKEFLQGAGIVVAVVSILIIGVAIMSNGMEPVEQQSTKVVGTYKECDIIQWHYGPLAEYKYFLYCPK